MIIDRIELMRLIEGGTQRLVDAVGRLADEDVRLPSSLPGWSRGHVLTHIARGGDALRNLLVWARTGVVTPPYASQRARDADIEAGSGRPVAELLADVSASAARFRAEAGTLQGDDWQVSVGVLGSMMFPAEQVLVRRLVEIEVHHVDLGIGYGASDWPEEFAAMDLPEPMRSQREERRSW
ncbi:hypothetical protein GCM10022226_56420 [Sphaerisporangium flaviroseum]|uniref:Mycothiol-dependent maleylpyruvate isomerase metal-binding domain-containing protein n=1 Tax=Sphaerisporangium flaviroseum TaxID=509199 RepID=A0ABP7IW27_9ACTN